MRRLVALLPVLVALQVGVSPALAWTWPVDGPVVRPFVFGDDPYAAGQHRGIDIAAAAGAPVVAPVGGTVTFAGPVPGGARAVAIRTPDGYSVTLVELGATSVTRGAAVEEGAAVGVVGAGGDAVTPESHVHLGVRSASDPNGYVDPLAFLPPRPAPPPPDEPAADEPEQEPAAGPAARQPAAARPARGARTPESRAREGERAPARRLPRGRPSAAEDAPARREERAVSPVRREAESLPATRTALGSFEPVAARSGPQGRPLPRPDAGERPAASEPPGRGRPWKRFPLAVALGLALAGALAIRLRQLRDARPADRAAAMLLDVGRGSAEDAALPRAPEDDRLVHDGDLEGVLLRQAKPLADLDRYHDPAELVDPADDPRRACSSRGLEPRRHRRNAPRRLVRRPPLRIRPRALGGVLPGDVHSKPAGRSGRRATV
jgi:hypothetical protein